MFVSAKGKVLDLGSTHQHWKKYSPPEIDSTTNALSCHEYKLVSTNILGFLWSDISFQQVTVTSQQMRENGAERQIQTSVYNKVLFP